jgi:hypothetical protein
MGTVVRSNAPYAAHNVPSLGVITPGDIVIPQAITNVDAYLFANKNIDTCIEGTSLVAATRKLCATAPLAVHGFLMAHDILFHRLGPANTKGIQPAEIVTLSPQIYLNPPKFFDFTIDGNFANGQGEKQPLF